MKILFINRYFYNAGGAEVHFFNLRELLKANGYLVIDFSMRDPRNFDSPFKDYFIDHINFGGNESIVERGVHLLYNIEAKNKLEQLIKKEKPDIAHLHNWCYHLSPSILRALQKYEIPTVQTLHDAKLICPNQTLYRNGEICEKCKKHKYYQTIFNKCVRNRVFPSLGVSIEQYWYRFYLRFIKDIDAYISPSHFLINKCKEWGIKKRIYHLPNYVDLEEYQPSYENGGYILFVGNVDHYKGIMTLIEAIKDLPEVRLLIVGSGRLNSEIENLGLTNIEILGYRPHNDVVNILRAARFTVVPSECYDNFPFAVLESMAMGKPVIGSNLGGIPETIDDGNTGYIFKNKDSSQLKEIIKKLYYNEELIEKLGRNARRVVEEKYSKETYLEKLLQIYDSLLNEN